MCEFFSRQEEEYKKWLSANPNGYIFNHFKGSDPNCNVLHRNECMSINRDKDRGKWTFVEKICCNDLVCITETLEDCAKTHGRNAIIVLGRNSKSS